MANENYTVLCIDDESNILNALKRLLRKEDYRLFTSTTVEEAHQIITENDVHVIMSDQRMPGKSGTEFFSEIIDSHPDIIRIILSGYTDVDSITESINKGHIYKFLLKPWNDDNLKLEIRQSIEQYALRKSNRELHEKVLEQNAQLKKINETLEQTVRDRVREIELKSHALELSHAVLDNLPIPVIGISVDGLIVLCNQKAQAVKDLPKELRIGEPITEVIDLDFKRITQSVIKHEKAGVVKKFTSGNAVYDLTFFPLAQPFRNRGVVMTLKHPSGI